MMPIASMTELFAKVAAARMPDDQWCDVEKAETLAALVVSLRPLVTIEIGVWKGASSIPMLLAMQHIGHGKLIAIDPWNHEASMDGELPENAEWWGHAVGAAGHQTAYEAFIARIEKHELAPFCEVVRQRSDDVVARPLCTLLHVDGNHSDQAVRDVERFGPKVIRGGVLVMDDLRWATGGVARAHDAACRLGFVDLYPLGTGVVMQRVALSA